MCPNSYLGDYLLLASGKGGWRTTTVLITNVCLKIIQHTTLQDTFILPTNLLMDLLQPLQRFFIEIIRYRSVKVYNIFKNDFLIMLQVTFLPWLYCILNRKTLIWLPNYSQQKYAIFNFNEFSKHIGYVLSLLCSKHS